jgi:hypothetical protein
MSFKTVIGFTAESAIAAGDLLQLGDDANTLKPSDDTGFPFCIAIAARVAGEPVDAVLPCGTGELVAAEEVTALDFLVVDSTNPGRVKPATGAANEQMIAQAITDGAVAGDKVKVVFGLLGAVNA